MKDASIPGVIVGIWGPESDYEHAFGVADKRTGAPMRTDFYSRIGSVTKTFTVTAVLQLVDQGKLRLDDPISQYIPDVPSGDDGGWIGHTGVMFGYQTAVFYLPQAQTTLVFFINTDVPHEAGTALARALTSVIAPDNVYR